MVKPLAVVGSATLETSRIAHLTAQGLGIDFVDLGRQENWSVALDEALRDRPSLVVTVDALVAISPEWRAATVDRFFTVWVDDGGRSLERSMPGADTGLAPDGFDQRRRILAPYSILADQIVDVDTSQTGEVTAGLAAAVASDLVASLTAASDPTAKETVQVEMVSFGDGRSYPVFVGRGAIDRIGEVLPTKTRRVAVVTQAEIGIELGLDLDHKVFIVPDGEQAKRLSVLGDLASEMAQWGMTRNDLVVSVGGGVVSDLAGYLASSYHRGIEVIHISTTLLGQIDAAIGGKCGVNLPEGKNLLGAFKQPAAVICDTATLATLPVDDFQSGMGELAKYHFLGGGDLDRLPLTSRVAAAVRIKGDVVAADEREGGLRAILNYGHTLAHSVEAATGFQVRHGEAVAVGLIYAAELAHRMERIDSARVAEHRRVARAYGLHTTIPPGLDRAELVDGFSRDKKALEGVTFVLDGPNGVEPVRIDEPDLLSSVIATVEP